MTLPLSTWTVLEAARKAVLAGQIGGLLDVAGILACITAGITAVSLVRDYIRGDELDSWDIIRPLVLMMLVCEYQNLVLAPVDGVTNIVTRSIVEYTDIDMTGYVSEWGSNMEKIGNAGIENYETAYQAELEDLSRNASGVSRFFGKMWLAVKKVLMEVFSVRTLTFGGIIGGILFLLVKVLLLIQQIICTVFLLVNSLLGPFILATGILPQFNTGFLNWLSRYIQISMWIPVGYIMLAVNLWISRAFLSPGLVSEVGLGTEWLMIALQVVSLMCVASVPKVAAWIVESTGANDAHGALSSPARLLARKLIKL